MFGIFFRQSCGVCINRFVVFSTKKYLQKVICNNFYPSSTSTNIMPPKRKAATAKSEQADLVDGGDYAEPVAPKVRRGRPKREIDVENQVVAESAKIEKPKRLQKAMHEKEQEDEPESDHEDKKKTAKKRVPAKGNGKVKEKAIPDKKRSTRAKKAADLEEQPEDEEEKLIKKGKKGEETNGDVKVKDSRKKKTDNLPEESKAKGRKKADKEEKVEKPGPSNNTITKWDKINFACTKKNGEGKKANLKISCWNIGGMKGWVKKQCMAYLQYEDPDILCVQETKCNEDKLPQEILDLEHYKQYWCASNKDGYAGVGLLTKKEPLNVTYGINVPDQDKDGRCITAEFDEYYVVCVYVPNSGRKLVTLPKRLEWNTAFKDYIKSLDEKKPVIICGDMNVAHNEIDLARPANNTKNAGFTKEEREGMTDFLQDGYIDTFRKLYPEKTDVYTFWTYMSNARTKNVGWRLDYFIVSERIMDKVCDNAVRSDVLGSDHCPITLFINI